MFSSCFLASHVQVEVVESDTDGAGITYEQMQVCFF